MKKDRELELSPTALNPLVGIEVFEEKIETTDVAEHLIEE